MPPPPDGIAHNSFSRTPKMLLSCYQPLGNAGSPAICFTHMQHRATSPSHTHTHHHHPCPHTHIHTHTHTHTYTHTHTSHSTQHTTQHTHTHTKTHADTQAHMHTDTQTHIHILSLSLSFSLTHTPPNQAPGPQCTHTPWQMWPQRHATLCLGFLIDGPCLNHTMPTSWRANNSFSVQLQWKGGMFAASNVQC